MGRLILLLDDDDDLCETTVEVFEQLGERCVGVRSLAGLQALGQSALDCKVAILDINLGPSEPSGLDAYLWLKERAFAGRVVFLTGHAKSHPLVKKAIALGCLVYEKPISMDTLRDIGRDGAPKSRGDGKSVGDGAGEAGREVDDPRRER